MSLFFPVSAFQLPRTLLLIKGKYGRFILHEFYIGSYKLKINMELLLATKGFKRLIDKLFPTLDDD